MGAPQGWAGIDPRVIVDYPPINRISVVKKPGVRWFPAEIDETARVEAGTIVQQGDSRPTVIGPGAWVMTSVTVSHDVQVGANAEVSHGSRLGGYVTVGEGAKLGMGVVVLPHRQIGAHARVGAGAVVTKDVPAGETWVGVPAHKLERDEGPGTPEAMHGDGFTVRTWDRWWRRKLRPATS